MKASWSDFLASLPSFSEELHVYLRELGIESKALALHADHIGLRMRHVEDVERLKDELLTLGTLISSASVNGREIYLFQLHAPLVVGAWNIYGVELPYPKPNHAYEDGWEHIEFVLPSPASTLSEMRDSLCMTFPHLALQELAAKGEYEESMPLSEEDQLPNPSLVFEKRRGLAAKFHPRPIQEVVGYQ